MESKNTLNNLKKERRGFPRINVSVTVDYSISGSQAIKTVQTKNVSAGGICLIADEDIHPGTVLELKIYLPNQDSPVLAQGKIIWENEVTVLTKGKVAWERDSEVFSDERTRLELGVEFFKIEVSDLQKISQFVLSLIPSKRR